MNVCFAALMLAAIVAGLVAPGPLPMAGLILVVLFWAGGQIAQNAYDSAFALFKGDDEG